MTQQHAYKSSPGPERYYGARKRLFIGLITVSSTLVCAVLLLFWLVPFVGLPNIHPALPYAFGFFIFALIVLIAWASLGLVLTIVKGRPVLGTGRIRGLTIKLFLPLMVVLGRFFGISKEKVRLSFIRVNNELVRGQTGRFQPGEILILTPHCLQNSQCSVRLTHNVNHCKQCGQCPVDALIKLRDHYGVLLAVATGGTIARRIVVQQRPKLIVAVACERDLTSGIQDTYPLPVYGVLNQRPNGPCLDTLVPMDMMEAALRMFIVAPPPPLSLQAAVMADSERRRSDT